MCNRILLHFSLELLLLKSVHSSSMCCSLKGRIKPYKLLFTFSSGFLCSPRVMGPCSGFPVGLVHLVKPKVKAGADELPRSQAHPAHTSCQPFLPNSGAWSCLTIPSLSLCPPASPKVLRLQQFLSSLLPPLHTAASSTPSFIFSPSPLLSLLMYWLQNPSAWFLPLAVISPPPLPPHLYVIQLHFSPMIKQNGQMGAQKSLWRGFALILGFPSLCSFVCGYPLLCSCDF